MKCILDLPNEVVNMIIEYVGNCKINEKGEILLGIKSILQTFAI